MITQISKTTIFLLLISIVAATSVLAQNHQQDQIDSLNKLFSQTYYTDLTGAEKLATQALQLSAQSGYSFGEAGAYSNLSVVYQKKENNAKAIEAGFTALKIYDKEERFKRTFEYGNTLVRLAKAFFMEQDLDRSDAYGRQAIALAENIQDGQLLALGYETIGNNYAAALQIDSALHYYNKAKSGFIKTNYGTGLANLANNTGAMYSRNGNNQKAVQYFEEALIFYQQNNLKASFTTIHFNIALSYFQLRSYNKALQHLDSAAYYAQKFKRLATLLDIYAQKARCYQGLGNLDSCASYFEKTLSLKDTINNDTYKKELAALQTQSDVYKKETENQLLSKDKRIAVLYRNLAIAGIIGLAVALAFLLLNQRIRIHRRVKNQLEEEVALRTKEIFRQKEMTFHTNLQMKLALNSTKSNAHFAVNLLSTIQQVVLQQKPQEAQIHLAKLTQLLQYILAKSPLERVPLQDELQMLEYYIQLEQVRLSHRFEYNIISKVDGSLSIPALLLLPFVENAIQHGVEPITEAPLQLKLKVEVCNSMLTATISDNGVNWGKNKNNKLHLQNRSITQERLDLLTHLTHKNHLAIFEEIMSENGSISGNKIVLQIPLEAQPISPDLGKKDDLVEFA